VTKWLVVLGGFGVAALGLVMLAGVALWHGAGLAARAAGAGMERARAALERAAPPEAREQVRARLEGTITALREGDFDARVLGEMAWWLPGVLADGQLDARETQALWEKLDRLVREAPREPGEVRS
jgi:hypothetical protein